VGSSAERRIILGQNLLGTAFGIGVLTAVTELVLALLVAKNLRAGADTMGMLSLFVPLPAVAVTWMLYAIGTVYEPDRTSVERRLGLLGGLVAASAIPLGYLLAGILSGS